MLHLLERTVDLFLEARKRSLPQANAHDSPSNEYIPTPEYVVPATPGSHPLPKHSRQYPPPPTRRDAPRQRMFEAFRDKYDRYVSRDKKIMLDTALYEPNKFYIFDPHPFNRHKKCIITMTEDGYFDITDHPELKTQDPDVLLQQVLLLLYPKG